MLICHCLISLGLLFGLGKSGNVKGIEGSLTIPALGRPFLLGSLYDVRQDRLVAPGLSLWDTTTINKNKISKDMPYTDAVINAQNSFNARANSFDLSVSLKASFIGGLVKVEGSAEYLRSESSTNHEVSVALTYKTRTHVESLSMEQLGHGHIDYPYIFDEVQEATHVITAVEYGAGAVFQFKKDIATYSKKKSIKGDLKIAVKFVIATAEGHGSIKLTEQQNHTLQTMSCKFIGDVRLLHPPTTWTEAVQAYKNLPKLINKTTAIPIKVYLYPLGKLDSKGQRLVRQISVSLLKEVTEKMEDYAELWKTVGDLQMTEAYQKLGYFNNHVERYMSAIEVHRDKFFRGLSILLPKIRGRGAEEVQLIDFMHGSEQSYSMDLLAEWSQWRLREAGALHRIMTWKPEAWLVKPGAFEELLFDDTIEYIFVLNLGLFLPHDKSTSCINANCTQADKAVTSWLKTPITMKLLEKWKMFENIVRNNWDSKEHTVLVIKENLIVDKEEKVQMNFYSHQTLAIEDMKLPEVENLRVTKETCAKTSLAWDFDNPFLDNYYIRWGSSINSSHLNELWTKNPSTDIPFEPDFEMLLQPVFRFGKGDKNFTLKHRTSLGCKVTTPAPAADSHILLIGGLDASSRSSMEHFYPSDPTKSRAVTQSLYNDRRQLVTGKLKDGSIIIAGGWSHGPQGMTPSNTAEIFIPTSESSIKAAVMAEHRAFAGGAVLNGVFHVCGGVNGADLLSTCELYQSGKWVPGSSMTGPRSGLAMAAANGHIYAIGGCADKFCSSLLATAESSAGGAWAAVASMHSPRVRHAVAALGQFIYVCGGRGKNGQSLSSCERYDSQSGQWSQGVAKMAEARSDFSLAAFNGRLVAMGGTGVPTSSTAEIYNPEKNEWEALQHLIHPRSGASAVTV